MKLLDQVSLVQISASSDEAAIQALAVAVGYIGEDGTQKLCGDSCIFHIEAGQYKKRCTLLGKKVVVPKIASCTQYAKGQSADKWQTALQPVVPEAIFTPEEVGLVIGKVQCKRCVRRGDVPGVCDALTDVLKRVCKVNAVFKIVANGCCNWNKAPGQKEVTS